MSTPVRLVQTRAGIADGCVAIEEFIALGSSAATRTTRRCIAAAFTDDFVDLTGLSNAGLANQLGAALPVRGVVARLLVATGYPASADYVVASGSTWGSHASIVHPQFAALFERTALGLGFSSGQVHRQWNTLAKISVTAGSAPNRLSANSFNASTAELTRVYSEVRRKAPTSWSTPLHGLKATLVALGTLSSAPSTRISPSRRGIHWEQLGTTHAPLLIATLRRYLTQIAVSMRPGSVARVCPRSG